MVCTICLHFLYFSIVYLDGLTRQFGQFQPSMEGSRVDECPDYMHASSELLQPRDKTARAKRGAYM